VDLFCVSGSAHESIIPQRHLGTLSGPLLWEVIRSARCLNIKLVAERGISPPTGRAAVGASVRPCRPPGALIPP
jgi:hypothetical protein